jgi:hypothetical protein
VAALDARLRIRPALAIRDRDEALKVDENAAGLASITGIGTDMRQTVQHGGIGIRLTGRRIDGLAVAGELSADGVVGEDDLSLPGGLTIGKHAALVAGRGHGTKARTPYKVAHDRDRPAGAGVIDALTVHGVNESRRVGGIDDAGRQARHARNGRLALLALELGAELIAGRKRADLSLTERRSRKASAPTQTYRNRDGSMNTTHLRHD